MSGTPEPRYTVTIVREEYLPSGAVAFRSTLEAFGRVLDGALGDVTEQVEALGWLHDNEEVISERRHRYTQVDQ